MTLNIPRDKMLHFVVGVVVASFALIVWRVLSPYFHADRAGVLLAMPLATFVAGVTKEFADWLDNQSKPGTHTVSVGDALATFAPGVILSMIGLLAANFK